MQRSRFSSRRTSDSALISHWPQGNIHVAFEAAKEIKEKDNFMRLAQTAILLGNVEITEKCYQFVRSLDKLNFFYAATGSV